MGKVEVLCLGTSTTENALYTGAAAANYVVLLDAFPVLLIGCGAGAIRQCKRLVDVIPECILLLDASLDQTLELPVLLLAETAVGRRLRIFGSNDTCLVVRDLMQLQLAGRSLAQNLVTFITIPVAADGAEEFFGVVHDFSLLLHQYEHANGRITNGAVLCYKDQTCLSLTGPVPFDASLFTKLCQSSFVIVWGSPHGTATAASFAEVAMFEKRINAGRRQDEAVVFLLGAYGGPQDSPMVSGYVTALQQDTPVVLLAGDLVSSPFTALHLPLPTVRKAAPLRLPGHAGYNGNNVAASVSGIAPIPQSHADPASANTSMQATVRQLADSPRRGSGPGSAVNLSGAGVRGAAGGGSNGLIMPVIQKEFHDVGPDDLRRVYLFSNEDKGRPGKLVMLSHFRTFEQLRTKAAEVLQIRPLKELCYVTGERVDTLEEIPTDCELIAVKRAGNNYNPRDLPRLLKTVKRVHK